MGEKDGGAMKGQTNRKLGHIGPRGLSSHLKTAMKLNSFGRCWLYLPKIFRKIRDKQWLSKPRQIMQEKYKLNPSNYCSYHKSIRHQTDNFIDLLRQLWRLYEEGKL